MSRRVSATSPLRLMGYAAILTAMAFSQSGGLIVADSKFDLVTAPGRFLAKALHLWDPVAAFGQIQNQAYGYLWPMGPFFVLGDVANLPEWAVQRVWWALLLCLAFFGVVRLAQELRLGTPWAQVVAGFAYVLTPRLTTLVGATSVEVWPMALAPWVLLPLVRGSREGSTRLAAALSALVVATCGGVNAVAVSAVLPLGVIWILTRGAGPRKWPLLGWWTLFTVLATFWWWGPLLLMGRYSPPFLDYIENATITTLPTDLTRTIIGTSDWVAYFAGIDFQAGNQLVTTPFLVVDAAAVAALGLAGLAVRGNPHQRFLTLGVLAGVTLVGWGYAGDLAGFFADARQLALDEALAPFRNLHKYDVVLRLPLILGMAHLLASLPTLFSGVHGHRTVLLTRVVSGLALVALASPWLADQIAPRDGVAAVPDYWPEVAAYLEQTDDGTVTLVVPASGFGIYTWGNVHDDILQGLATSPWAVRNVVPLAQPGNVILLDALTGALESGRPSDDLAPFLAANGIGRLVVRNDLDRFQTATPDPVLLETVLTGSAGITLARSFGPPVGAPPVSYAEESDTRLVTGNGAATRVPSVQVYDVTGAAAATLQPLPAALLGDPGSGRQVGAGGLGFTARALAGDAPVEVYPGLIVTDGLKRREKNFAHVRNNESQTLAAGAPFRLNGPEHRHRIYDDQTRWETTESWSGDVTRVFASSSQSYADAPAPIQRGAHPGAALDGDGGTSWRSAANLEPVGQWWQADLRAPSRVVSLRVALAPDSAPVEQLTISNGTDSAVVAAPEPGQEREYTLGLDPGRYLRVTGAGDPLGLPGALAISEVESDVLDAQRFLTLPELPEGARVDGVALTRDQEPAACGLVAAAFVCNDALVSPGEDGDTLARTFTLPYAETFDATVSGSLRRAQGVGTALLTRYGLSVQAPTSPGSDVASSGLAILDDDPATTWISVGSPTPRIRVGLAQPSRLRQIQLTVNEGAAASAPRVVKVSHGPWSQTVTLDESGTARLLGPRTREFSVRILQVAPAFSVDGRDFVPLPPGISELKVNARSPSGWAGRVLEFPCGAGPVLGYSGQLVPTSVTASAQGLIRGEQVAVTPCSGSVVGQRGASPELGQGENTLLVRPTPLFRVDAVTLRSAALVTSGQERVAVARDSNGMPAAVQVTASTVPRLLALPQNLNAGWVATAAGDALEEQRVDGWRQAWVVPAGVGGTIELRFEPQGRFSLMLGLGGGLVLVTLLAALWPARRSARIEGPLRTGPPGLLDLAVVLTAGGLLAGWLGLAVMVAAVLFGVLMPAFAGWPLLGAAALVSASVSVAWPRISEQSWSVEWSQSMSLVALGALAAALASLSRSERPG